MLEKMITITAPGGRVRVEAQSKGSELRIGVSSSGPSLPEEEIADVFSRLHSRQALRRHLQLKAFDVPGSQQCRESGWKSLG